MNQQILKAKLCTIPILYINGKSWMKLILWLINISAALMEIKITVQRIIVKQVKDKTNAYLFL